MAGGAGGGQGQGSEKTLQSDIQSASCRRQLRLAPRIRAANDPLVFTITEKAPDRALS